MEKLPTKSFPPTLVEVHSLHGVGTGGLFLGPFPLDLAVRPHVQNLVDTQPEIATFQEFFDVIRLASYTTYSPFVDDPELNFLGFVDEGKDGGGLCGDGRGLSRVDRPELI